MADDVQLWDGISCDPAIHGFNLLTFNSSYNSVDWTDMSDVVTCCDDVTSALVVDSVVVASGVVVGLFVVVYVQIPLSVSSVSEPENRSQ